MDADIPDNLGKRVGEIGNLPAELRAQLVVGKRDELEEVLIGALKNLEGMANLDELLVAAYRATGKVYKRTFVSNKLYRMAQSGLVESVPKRKGVYRLAEPKPTWGRYDM